jgi:hypothetical protein
LTGSLTIHGESYKLEHAVAFATGKLECPAIAVLLCNKRLPLERLKASLEARKADEPRFLSQPRLCF